MQISRIKGWFLVSAGMLMLLAGCGEDTKTEYVEVSAPASTYLVEYVPGTMPNGMMMNATMGKSTFQIRVRKRSDGSAAMGLASSMTVYPLMHMNDGRNHASPADPVTESGTPGTYDCTVYYLMPDIMGSTVTGFWDLTVTIGTESAIFILPSACPWATHRCSNCMAIKTSSRARRPRHCRKNGSISCSMTVWSAAAPFPLSISLSPPRKRC